MSIKIIEADYSNAKHAQHIIELLDAYACDPMGGGQPLASGVKDNLIGELSRLPFAFSLIAYLENEPVGLVNCFESFSTFACRPIINIHDLMVVTRHRGKGISKRMLNQVEAIAREKQCCKITLEVLSNNDSAQSAYRNFGFNPYQLDPASGSAEFWQKKLE